MLKLLPTIKLRPVYPMYGKVFQKMVKNTGKTICMVEIS